MARLLLPAPVKINQTASHRQNVVITSGFATKPTHSNIRYLRSRVPRVFRQHCSIWVWADTAYRSKKNETFLADGMFTSHIHQKRKPRRLLPERIARANTRRSKIRAQVEHVFAGQKHRMGLVVRTTGIARATIKIGMPTLSIISSASPGATGVLPQLDATAASQRQRRHEITQKYAAKPGSDVGATITRQNQTVFRGVQLSAPTL